MHKKISNKGQGAIEYLLVIGTVIIVVAVVIIALSGTLNETKQFTDKNEISNVNDPLHNLLKPDFCTNEGEEVCNTDKTYKVCTNEKWVSFAADLEHCEVECLENTCDNTYFIECSNFVLQEPRLEVGECNATCESDGTESCTTQLCGEGTRNYTCSNGIIESYSTCIANTPQCNGSAPACTNYLTLQTCSAEKCIETTSAGDGNICIASAFVKLFDSGFGTSSQPYKISNCKQLQNINFSTLTLDKNFELDNNIDCTGPMDTIESIGACGTGTCLDGDENAFKGTLDGKNYSIKANFITTLDSGHALFSVVKGATIKNITLSQAYINSGTAAYKGGFAGYCENSTFENLKNNATVTSTATGVSYAGGICGYAASNVTIKNCVNTGSITGRNAGGITGQLSSTSPNPISTITNSYNTGTISAYASSSLTGYLGGITGYSDRSKISQTYNSGTINPTKAHSRGGIVGYAYSTTTQINNSFNTGSIPVGGTNTGGIVGLFTVGTPLTNVFWINSSIARCCGTVVNTSCVGCSSSISASDFNIHNGTAHAVYYGTPNWDNNWIWSATALPKLSWQP